MSFMNRVFPRGGRPIIGGPPSPTRGGQSSPRSPGPGFQQLPQVQTAQESISSPLRDGELRRQLEEKEDSLIAALKRGYWRSVKARVVFATNAGLAIAVSCGLGVALQQFFMLFMPHLGQSSKEFLMICGPITIFVTGFLASEMSELAGDATSEPPFKNLSYSAFLLINPHFLPGNGPQSKKMFISRLFCVLLEVTAWLAGGLAYILYGRRFVIIFRWMVGSLLCATVVMSCIQGILRTMMMWCPPTKRIQKHLNMHADHPDSADELNDYEEHKTNTRSSAVGATAALCLVLGGLLLYSVYYLLMLKGAIGFSVAFYVLYMPSAIMIAVGLMRVLPVNAFFPMTVGAFFVIGWTLVGMMGTGEDHTCWDNNPVYEPGDEGRSFANHFHRFPEYPICDTTWGRDQTEMKKRMSAIDLAILADAMYADDMEDRDGVIKMARASFVGTDLADIELEEISEYFDIGRFAIFKVPAARMRVVSVRGTTTAQDVLADADLWSFIFVLQAFEKLVPVSGLLSHDLIQFLNKWLSPHTYLAEARVWDPIQDGATRALLSSIEDDYMTVLTGHSLGGGLAQIIAAHLQIPAVVFSPVGVGFSMSRFNMHESDAYRTITLVQPQRDIVPTIDQQIGYVQHIQCRATEAPNLNCHSLRRTLCELHAVCGDGRKRNMDASCKKFTGEGDWALTQKQVQGEREELSRQRETMMRMGINYHHGM